jgi:hypothetical protein
MLMRKEMGPEEGGKMSISGRDRTRSTGEGMA